MPHAEVQVYLLLGPRHVGHQISSQGPGNTQRFSILLWKNTYKKSCLKTVRFDFLRHQNGVAWKLCLDQDSCPKSGQGKGRII